MISGVSIISFISAKHTLDYIFFKAFLFEFLPRFIYLCLIKDPTNSRFVSLFKIQMTGQTRFYKHQNKLFFENKTKHSFKCQETLKQRLLFEKPVTPASVSLFLSAERRTCNTRQFKKQSLIARERLCIHNCKYTKTV